MFAPITDNTATKTTSYKVVLPFYVYASLSFLIATILLLASSGAFRTHYFNPHILAITHIMTLGWATMLIIGASHQLFPVMIEGKLYSEKLAYLSFILAATGIPLLVYGFYKFDIDILAKWGATLIVLAILSYLVNIVASMKKSRVNVQAVYVFTATLWLLFTATLGLILIYNFNYSILGADSIHYLPVHAHAGIIGWFLLLVFGVGSRLIPMFLISKYTNARLLWVIYFLINAALLIYITIFYSFEQTEIVVIPAILVLAAVLLFIYYCYQSHKQRLRKQVDEQVKISLLSILMLLLPIVLFFIIVAFLLSGPVRETKLILTYGFMIFFGWLTAIILGMTFKTLPFIVWNKVYHVRSASGKTPNPKDLFNHYLFKIMCIVYLSGFVLFAFGMLSTRSIFLKGGAILLIITAILYNWNVFTVINHKAVLQ